MKLKIPSLVVCSLLSFSLVAVGSERHEADEAIEKNLRTTLNQRHVHVNVHEGIVTLEGRVRSEQDREAIEAMVRSTPGVAAVKDRLKVALPAPGEVAPPVTGVVTPPEKVVVPSERVVVGSIPVYTTAPPEAAPVVTMPAPVVIPDYPRFKVQATSSDDLPTANRIARQLRGDALPASGYEDVAIMVRNGIVSLKGTVESRSDRDALINSIQRAGGMTAIYDQLQVR